VSATFATYLVANVELTRLTAGIGRLRSAAMEAEIERLTEAAARLEREAAALREDVAALAEAQLARAAAERERAAAERERAEAERASASAAADAKAAAGGDEVAGVDGDAAGPDDAEARLVAYSMVLDGRPRDEVAAHLESELGFAAHGPLLDELYAEAG